MSIAGQTGRPGASLITREIINSKEREREMRTGCCIVATRRDKKIDLDKRTKKKKIKLMASQRRGRSNQEEIFRCTLCGCVCVAWRKIVIIPDWFCLVDGGPWELCSVAFSGPIAFVLCWST